MKRHRCLGMVFATALSALSSGLPLGKDEAQIVKARLIPYPKQVELKDGPVVKIDKELPVTVTLRSQPGDLAKRVRALFKSDWGATPKLVFKADASMAVPQDGYRFKASAATGLEISASDEGGLLNALKTLRQIAEPERGVERLSYYFLPEMSVEDAPALLCTTWNYMHSQDMYRMLTVGAHAAWGYEGTGWNAMSSYNQHLRQIGWDMPVTRYRDTGDAQWQVPPENALLQ